MKSLALRTAMILCIAGLLLVWSCQGGASGGGGGAGESDDGGAQTSAEAGAALYADHKCGDCHGATGGGGQTGPPLTNATADAIETTLANEGHSALGFPQFTPDDYASLAGYFADSGEAEGEGEGDEGGLVFPLRLESLRVYDQAQGDPGAGFRGTEDRAYGINNSWHVVGTAMSNIRSFYEINGEVVYETWPDHAYWNEEGSDLVWDLHTPNSEAIDESGLSSEAYAINDLNEIVGRVGDGIRARAFLVDVNSLIGGGAWDAPPLTDLGTLDGGSTSSAFDINNRGQVVGESETSDGNDHAFLWEDGTMTDLGVLGSATSCARGINESGQVVGYSDTVAGVVHAFLWENGVMTDLGTLGGSASLAYDINDLGQVVGSSETAAGVYHAFLWEDGAMRDLGALLYENIGYGASGANAINESGWVVGWATIAVGVYRAFLWENGTMHNLHEITDASSRDWELQRARDINDEGVIVGFGKDGSETRSWRVVPANTPPPSVR